ncbi:hypothetical protein NP493_409g08000 [Ridgeia piscesae]|uniref:DEP domain-containing protein n=1 Tax=Ridgeia piscesae TaxID=27915 RepID=A0AAD9NUI2_RIDPI|nr:hypothetical protein NP493_409g08000 [Ridgeia piscesae]
MSVQPHHKHGSYHIDNQQQMENSSPPTREVVQAAKIAVELRKNKTHRSSESSDSQDNPYCVRSRSIAYSSTAGGSVDSLKDVHTKELTHVPSSSAMSTVDSESSLTSLVPACEKDGGVCTGSAGKFCSHSVGLYSRSASYHKDLGPLSADQVGHSWLWGVTGEQEWTIEIKTGMDWPSMTLPASLPLTTDYFPDKRSIQVDYVISDYSVVPENVMSDQSLNSLGAGHKPVTTLQVYKEMIATRIARGFQIVLQQPKLGTNMGNLSSSPYQTGTARWRVVPKAETPEEITLSNGRIFHKLTLNGQTVTVTRYWTRHPYAQKTHHYTYRFQVPDSETYDVSWTQFTNDKLEKYNWNHLDQYVTTRGEEGFSLIEPLKYWRSRFFLLPSNNAATRRIADGETTLCDIYEERTAQERSQLTDAFLRFIEHLNKIKRTVQARLAKVDSLTRRTSLSHLSPSADPVTSKQKAMGKVSEVPLDILPVGSASSSTPVGVEHRRASFAGHQVRGSIDESPVSLVGGGGKTAEGSLPVENSQQPLLSKTASSSEVVAAMMDITWGLKFLNRTHQCPAMPDYCFVSAEAANWLVESIEGDTSITEATDILQRLVDDRAICHASGNSRHRFIYGFYLYFVSAESEKKGTMYESYNVGFQHEWCEVAISCHDNDTGNTDIPEFPPREQSLQQVVDQSAPQTTGSKTEHGHSWGGGAEHSQLTGIAEGKAASLNMLDLHVCWTPVVSPLYKVVNVNIDPSGKSDREEYGTLRYHGNYSTSAAFELELRWIVGTGTILEELVSNWARKAGPCFHLISVPGDPFALPFTPGSDPLRGPIFVPLNLSCLTQPGQELFQEDEADGRQRHLHAFQECILRRYGFLRDHCQPERSRARSMATYSDSNYLQYVHCTGGMFVMIPDNRTTSPLPRQRKLAVNSHTEYITRQRSWTSKTRSNGVNSGSMEQKEHRSYYEVGFLWTWNFMMTKRTANTGDEFFQDRMLADFRSFCANADGRLRHLWGDTRTSNVTWESEDVVWESEGRDMG